MGERFFDYPKSMQNNRLAPLAFFLLFFISPSLFAASQTSQAHRLLEVSTLGPTLEAVHKALDIQLTNEFEQKDTDDEYRPLIRKSIQTGYEPKKVRSTLDQSIAASLDSKTLQKLIQWYSSKQGKRVLAAYHYMSSQEGYPKFARYQKEFNDNPPPLAERKMASDVVMKTKIQDIQVAMLTSNSRAMVYLFNEIEDPDDRKAQEDIEEDLKDLRKNYSVTLQNTSMASTAFALKQMSKADRKAYLQLISSAAGKKFAQAQVKAIDQALREAAERAITYLKKNRVAAR